MDSLILKERYNNMINKLNVYHTHRQVVHDDYNILQLPNVKCFLCIDLYSDYKVAKIQYLKDIEEYFELNKPITPTSGDV